MIKASVLAAALCATATVIAAAPAHAPENKTTGVDCRAGRYVNGDYVDRTFAENETEDQSEEFILPLWRTHEVAVKFITGSRQIVSTELYRTTDRSVVLERKHVDITHLCDEQTDLGYADEVLEFLDGGVSTENGALTYSCSATCALPTRPDGNR